MSNELLMNRDELLAGKSLTIQQNWLRIAELEAENQRLRSALREARLGVENVSAQARLCLLHVGAPEHQKDWVRREVRNEERFTLEQIDKTLKLAFSAAHAAEQEGK